MGTDNVWLAVGEDGVAGMFAIQTDLETYRHEDIYGDRQIDRKAGRHKDKKTDREIDIQTNKHTAI